MGRRSALHSTEFHSEFATQTARLLRRRFLWFTGILGGFGLVVIALTITAFAVGNERLSPGEALQFRLSLGISILSELAYIGCFLGLLITKIQGRQVLRLAMGLVIFDGVLSLLLRVSGSEFPAGLFIFMISYTLASAFIPWTVRQALMPAAAVLTINALLLLTPIETGQWFDRSALLGVVFSPLTALPGVLISWWRYGSRLREHQFSFMARRYGEVRHELNAARRIHEAMFPAPRDQGEVRFTYRYQPMRQIGGDYLHVALSPTECGQGERLCIIMLDVTGHGIPAALSVNRLYGELARIFGEDPCIGPGDVLRLLNRYVRLTMSPHSVYVTGLAVRIDPIAGKLDYANAGHPPAFHVGAQGSIDQLDSTTFLLGAVGDDDFEPHSRQLPFDPGDRLIAYTDGATEAMDTNGRMVGITGMLGLLASRGSLPQGHWPQAILDAIDIHRDGPPADDTLVVEVYRPVDIAHARSSLAAVTTAPTARSVTEPSMRS